MGIKEGKQFDFYTCPQCKGYSYVLTPRGKHVNCENCDKNHSIYGFVDNQILYWEKEVTDTTILEDDVQKLINNIINFILIIFAIAGILSLGYYMFNNIKEQVDILPLFFKIDKYLLLFYSSLVGDMYIYYRLYMDSRKKPFIKKRALDKEIENIEEFVSWKILYEEDKDHKINIAKFYNPAALKAVMETYLLAEKANQHEINNIDLLAIISDNQLVKLVFARLGINFKDYAGKVKRTLERSKNEEGSGIDFGLSFKQVLITAYFEAYKNRREYVTPVELLLALVKKDDTVLDIFDDLEITIEKIENVVDWIHLDQTLADWSKHYNHSAKHKPKSHMNIAMTARPTKLLDSVSQDFTIKAKMGHFFPLVGREKEVGEAFRVLKEGKGNILLLGRAGTGKTTIMEGIAQLMVSEDVPANLRDKRFVVLDPGVLIAGAEGVGGIEQRIVQVIHEIMIAGNVILGVEDIHNLLGAKSTGSGSDAGEILMNFLSQGYVKVIGTTTTPEYQKYIANKENFLRRFQNVKIEEMNFDNSIKVLEAKSGFTAYKQKVYFSYDALEACVTLTDRYIKDRYLPAKALDVMEEAAIYTREKKGEKTIVSRDEVAAVLSEKTNVELASITQSEADKLLNLEELMHKRVVGQNEAIEAVSKALRRSREELRDASRPIANFLFLGPTGVGKTETAKTIAEVYFGNEENMIRLDMSEYQEQTSVIKMIGDPNTNGYLTEAVRQKPFGLVLFDELEKAHPDILNLFLQVFEDGRLTDGKGRTIDFTNTIIIATSNAATSAIQAGFNEGLENSEIYEHLMDGMLDEFFRTEFINRFDRVVMFTPLTPEETVEVTKRMLGKLTDTLKAKGIKMAVTEGALLEFAEKGYSPKYGARPLRRLLQDTVDDALAKLMLQKKLSRRDIVILKPGGELEVKKAKQI